MNDGPPDLDELTSLLSQLEADPEPRTERRKHARTSPKGTLPATVELPGQAPIPATVRDMSRGGIGLTLPVPLADDAQFTFRATVGPRAVRATCRVASCRPNDTGDFTIGAEILTADRTAQPANPDIASPQPTDIDTRHVAETRQRLHAVLQES